VNVLHVIPSVAAKEGGPSFAVKAMTEALAREGVQVTIATTTGSREQGAGSREKRVAGIQCDLFSAGVRTLQDIVWPNEMVAQERDEV